MRKVALLHCLALALFWNTAALAQGTGPGNGNCLVPYRPNNDATAAAANTKFVQNAVGGGGGVPQNANTVLAGPTGGSPAAASFRALVGADLPAPFVVSTPVTTNTSTQPQLNLTNTGDTLGFSLGTVPMLPRTYDRARGRR